MCSCIHIPYNIGDVAQIVYTGDPNIVRYLHEEYTWEAMLPHIHGKVVRIVARDTRVRDTRFSLEG